jgi:hypothetical protein
MTGANMNTRAANTWGEFSNHQRSDMLTEVDFKWLMAGIGFWVDPTQLHVDPDYAQASLQNALQSRCEPLRRCAAALKTELEQESLHQR